MKVIILCGGIGFRLREETEFKPKPMVQVGGFPMLWHIMRLYAHWGWRDFILALGYKGRVIRDYFLDSGLFRVKAEKSENDDCYRIFDPKSRTEITVTLCESGLHTLPGERISRSGEYLKASDRQFAVTYGDGLTDLNLQTLHNYHNSQNTLATITGVHPRSKYGLVYSGSDNKVTRFVEKPVLSQWVNGGFMIFENRVLKLFGQYKSELDVLILLSKAEQLSLYRHHGFWYAVDTYKELMDLRDLWDQGNPPWKIWK